MQKSMKNMGRTASMNSTVSTMKTRGTTTERVGEERQLLGKSSSGINRKTGMYLLPDRH